MFGDGDYESVNTAEVRNVLNGMGHVMAALRKAGVSEDELAVIETALSHVEPKYKEDIKEPEPAEEDDGIIVDGVIERLQRGVHGFAPVWKQVWLRAKAGVVECLAGVSRPTATSNPQVLLSLPLTYQNTKVEICSQVLAAKFGRPYLFMISCTMGVGQSTRSMLLAVEDDTEMIRWIDRLKLAFTHDGKMAGPSMFRACQTGNYKRVKALIDKGQPVNRVNRYGCSSLHYAVKYACTTAIELGSGAILTANGTSASLEAQEALRVVVYLMSHGADARLEDNTGLSPLTLVTKTCTGFPKVQKLLTAVLDSSKYEVVGGSLYIVPDEANLQKHMKSAKATFEKQQQIAEDRPKKVNVGGVNYGSGAGNGTHNAHINHSTSHTSTHAHTHTNNRMNNNSNINFESTENDQEEGSVMAFNTPTARLMHVNTLTVRRQLHRHHDTNTHTSRNSNNNSMRASTSHSFSRGHEFGVRSEQGRSMTAGSYRGSSNAHDERPRSEMGRKQTHDHDHINGGIFFGEQRFGRTRALTPAGGSRPSTVAGTVEAIQMRRSQSNEYTSLNQRASTAPSHIQRMNSSSSQLQRTNSSGQRAGTAVSFQLERMNSSAYPFQKMNSLGGKDFKRMNSSSSQLQRMNSSTGRNGLKRMDSLGSRGAPEKPEVLPDSEVRQVINRYIQSRIRDKKLAARLAAEQNMLPGGLKHLTLSKKGESFSDKKAIIEALRTLRGESNRSSGNDLVRVNRLEDFLTHFGDALTKDEAKALILAADPTGSGYVDCNAFAAMVSAALPSALPPGKQFCEQDDVVLQMKKKKWAKQEREASHSVLMGKKGVT